MMTERELFIDTSYEFTRTKAYKKLKKLAGHLCDLTDRAFMKPERLKRMVAKGCGFKLLYGTEAVTEEVMEQLGALALEARVIEKMEALQAGETINFIDGYPSEQRSVLHTAVRDFFDSPNPQPKAAEAREEALQEYKKLENFIAGLDAQNRFTDMVCIGIGGSELGPKMLYNALKAFSKPNRRVHFISNVDPDDAASVLDALDLNSTLVMAVSKSGTTLETRTNEELARARYRKAGLKPEEHFIAATGKGSPMDDLKAYRAAFYMWDWIGGRYCGTSMVGGVMLAFAFGMEVYHELLRGANAMDKLALKREVGSNLPLLLALLGIWNRDFLGVPTLAVIPYSSALSRFSAHIQQLDMESNGKHIDRHGERVDYPTGPIIWGEPATNAQHSFFQLVHQGTDTIALEFIGFQKSQRGEDLEVEGTTSQEKLVANLLAQALALAMGQGSDNPNKEFLGNRPSSILLAKRLDAYTAGALLALYEHKVAFQGFIWNINSFDQEGVQLGKVLAKELLGRIAARKSGGGGEANPLGDTLLDQLDTL